MSSELKFGSPVKFTAGTTSTGNNNPTTDNTYSLGTASLRWSAVHNLSEILYGSVSGTITQQAANTTSSYSIKWPSAQGASSTFLQNDGSGNLSWVAGGGSGANTALSNLASVAINTGLLPVSDGTISLGSGSLRWASLFAGSLGVSTTAAPDVKIQVNTPTNHPGANLGQNLLELNSTSGFAYMTIGNGNSANAHAYIGGASQILVFGGVTDAGTLSEFLRLDAVTLIPGTDNTLAFGSASKRWSAIHNLSEILYGSTSGTITQQAANTTTSYSVKWPNAQGGASTFLQNDGSGNLSWASAGSGADITLTQEATPSSPSAGFSKLFVDTDNQLAWVNSNGVINYAQTNDNILSRSQGSDPNAEGTTTGWATYNDGSVASPVDGTGGTATGITFGRTANTVWQGAQAFSFAKDAANRQGTGVALAFTTTAPGYTLKKYTIIFNAHVPSGTFATSDMKVFLYNVTNSTLLTLTNNDIRLSWNGQYYISFDTQSTGVSATSWRLIFHVATTSASAYTVLFDNVRVVRGVPVEADAIQTLANKTLSSPTITSLVLGDSFLGFANTPSIYNQTTGSYLYLNSTGSVSNDNQFNFNNSSNYNTNIYSFPDLNGGSDFILTAGSSATVTNKDISPEQANTRDNAYIDEDWFDSVAGKTNWSTAVSGTAAAATLDATLDQSKHPGIVKLDTGTDTTGRAALYIGLTSLLNSANAFNFTAYVYLPTLSDGTNTYKIWIGFGDTTDGTDFVDGAYVTYTSAVSTNWITNTANNSTRSSTTSGTALTAAAWHRVDFSLNSTGSGINAYIDGSFIGNVVTNAPANTIGREFGVVFKIVKSAGTTARSMYVDYCRVYKSLSSNRT